MDCRRIIAIYSLCYILILVFGQPTTSILDKSCTATNNVDEKLDQVLGLLQKLDTKWDMKINDLEAKLSQLERNINSSCEIKSSQNVCDDKTGCHTFNATFTTLNATGRLGPTSIGNHYVYQSHDGMVHLENGTQLFTVPCTGNYNISVAGAASGYGIQDPIEYRGRGAWLSTIFNLQKGMVLKVLVGQTGGYNDISQAVGGGGGTFITYKNNTPIIIAGGGGGTQYRIGSRHWQCDGTTNQTGNPNYPNGGRPFPGGQDGHGATGGPGGGYSGGGGGGLLSGGRNGVYSSSGHTPPSGGESFIKGGLGGTGGHNNPKTTGGFGGGGGSFGSGGGGGGGGGYSGGASGDTRMVSCAGGGGSYNSGQDQRGISGANNDEGYAVVTWID